MITRGGKQQVPYLIDEARGIEMYESEDIVDYLREHYANGHVPQGIRDAKSAPGTC